MLRRFGELAPEHEVKFAPVNLQTVEADGTFTGYASVFGQVDLGQDLVMPGAFRESLATRGLGCEVRETLQGHAQAIREEAEARARPFLWPVFRAPLPRVKHDLTNTLRARRTKR